MRKHIYIYRQRIQKTNKIQGEWTQNQSRIFLKNDQALQPEPDEKSDADLVMTWIERSGWQLKELPKWALASAIYFARDIVYLIFIRLVDVQVFWIISTKVQHKEVHISTYEKDQ